MFAPRSPLPVPFVCSWLLVVEVTFAGMTIAMPCSSAAAITSSSRMPPPGWTTAATPACGRDLDAVGERVETVGGGRATLGPPGRLARRDLPCVDPALLPGADADRLPVRHEHHAFDFTYAQIRHASSRSRHCSSVGCVSRDDAATSRVACEVVGLLHEEPAGDLPVVAQRRDSGGRRFEARACACASRAARRPRPARSPAR